MNDNLLDYQEPVYTSLMERHVFFGIGETAFMAIAVITLVLMSLLSFWCIFFGAAAILVCRILCKKEPLLIEFTFQSILQAKFYVG